MVRNFLERTALDVFEIHLLCAKVFWGSSDNSEMIRKTFKANQKCPYVHKGPSSLKRIHPLMVKVPSN